MPWKPSGSSAVIAPGATRYMVRSKVIRPPIRSPSGRSCPIAPRLNDAGTDGGSGFLPRSLSNSFMRTIRRSLLHAVRRGQDLDGHRVMAQLPGLLEAREHGLRIAAFGQQAR